MCISFRVRKVRVNMCVGHKVRDKVRMRVRDKIRDTVKVVDKNKFKKDQERVKVKIKA